MGNQNPAVDENRTSRAGGRCASPGTAARAGCKGSASQTGDVLIRAVVVVALALLAWFGGRALLRGEAARLEEEIASARLALVEGRSEDFLAAFSPDVAYQRGQAYSDLVGAVAAWKRSGIRSLTILSQDVNVDGEDAGARLAVVVGPVFRGITVDVDLAFRKQAAGWRVTRFRWTRR